jgi:hypothetical protein
MKIIITLFLFLLLSCKNIEVKSNSNYIEPEGRSRHTNMLDLLYSTPYNKVPLKVKTRTYVDPSCEDLEKTEQSLQIDF